MPALEAALWDAGQQSVDLFGVSGRPCGVIVPSVDDDVRSERPAMRLETLADLKDVCRKRSADKQDAANHVVGLASVTGILRRGTPH